MRHAAILSSFVLVAALLANIPSSAADTQNVSAGGYTITGPFAHENLALFLVLKKDAPNMKPYLTLQEALDQKVVVVHETGDVNQLSVENVSADKDVYIQSGDIVKGGRQDRTIAQDFICPARSGKMPIDAFCVEHGRWTQRGPEDATLFATSANAVAGKDVKLAARQQRVQSQVWAAVASNQGKLAENAGQSVSDPRSESSYELTLENKKVRDTTDAYVTALQNIIDKHPDVIGYAFAINGKVNSADVYGSHDLFLKLWPKLLRSSAVESFAERQEGKTFPSPAAAAIKSLIEDVADGKQSQEKPTPRITVTEKETSKNVYFETCDNASKEGWVHRNYIAKDSPSEPGPGLNETPQPRGLGAENRAPEETNSPILQRRMNQNAPTQR